MAELTANGIPVQPVYTPLEVINIPHVEARGLLSNGENLDTPLGPQLVNPLARAGLAKPVRAPAPGLGANTREILESLGVTPSEIDKLITTKVISE